MADGEDQNEYCGNAPGNTPADPVPNEGTQALPKSNSNEELQGPGLNCPIEILPAPSAGNFPPPERDHAKEKKVGTKISLCLGSKVGTKN
jgi:hypothetical protein